MELQERVERAAKAIAELGHPEVAVILGSGLSDVLPLEGVRSLSFGEVPSFPVPTVAGHAGRVEVGKVEAREVLVQRGRTTTTRARIFRR